MKRIRILVVDDSLTVRKRIAESLSALPDFEVVAEAMDGKQAIEACQRLRPDAITLDMMMPVMTGLAATEYIMAHCPTPILVVSSSFNRGEVFKTYDALAAGAVDVLEKPADDAAGAEWERQLADRLRLISRIKVITHPRGRLAHLAQLHSAPAERESRSTVPALRRGGCEIVAMGASTGGPGAVVDILNTLPRDFPLPILAVIHLSPTFGEQFAEWLDGLSAFSVEFARDGDPLPTPGSCRVVLAPPDRHLTVQQGRLRLTREAERHSCRPSVDVFFESLAREVGPRCASVLLTGMGRDGAEGLLALRRAGAVTLAQDEASSVVFGMPREAIRLNAAQQILPLNKIAGALALLAQPLMPPLR
ncbi:MAG TPA: chemotaxis-specific protein-glutamate methyltransferase CheB [Phycisphaerae bacterium]|nr:chemotaxis-specific protein-glutamate methyltransferase CheB [Phycisphaerae bacterium]